MDSTRFRRSKKKHIFISHSSDDEASASKLTQKLEHDGHEVWIDIDDINRAEPLPRELNKALEWCEVFLLLWSKNAASSNYVELEWHAAWSGHKKIISLTLDNVSLPILLRSTRIDLRDFKTGMHELLHALK